ncbi:hypothetical protein PROFUN_01732 [Planoprotostelium fungivorum]|uniref:Uncharacterized protein n=1 Tax=Planoprotostelium fungivorum TaxID=1890364 RepID=A0A2P6MWJ2_9EUKA|nr:hypothetical protein PROFUN_01732 [Planoprotostelium fungivorum]
MFERIIAGGGHLSTGLSLESLLKHICASVFVFTRGEGHPMKRQRTDDVPPKNSSRKATVVWCLPETGPPYFSLVDDLAREMLSEVLDCTDAQREGMGQVFWNTVQEVAKDGENREEHLQLSGQHLHIKYRKMFVDEHPAVVVTAKTISSPVALRMGLPSELNAIADVLEEDVIRRTLGFEVLRVMLADYRQMPIFRVLSCDPNFSRLWGLTPPELHLTPQECQTSYSLLINHFDPFTKTSTFTMRVQQFPTVSFFVVKREILPGIFLSITVGSEIRPRLTGPLPNVVPVFSSNQVWKRNMWDEVIENCLRYIEHHTQYTTNTRQTLPNAVEFLSDDQMVFCYAYRNEKEGTHDGYNWKSSRGVLNTAGHLKKKYHYADLPNGRRLRRRVVWLDDVQHVFMIEYRHAENNCTETDKLIGPECMDWPRLLHEVHSTNQRLIDNVNDIGSHFDLAQTRQTGGVAPDAALSYVNSVLSRWASEYGDEQAKSSRVRCMCVLLYAPVFYSCTRTNESNEIRNAMTTGDAHAVVTHHSQRSMKRQKTDAAAPPARHTLPKKAMVVCCVPDTGPPYFSLVDDSAKELLSEVLDHTNTQRNVINQTFWNTVRQVARDDEQRESYLRLSGRQLFIKYRKALVDGQSTVVVTARTMSSAATLPLGLPPEVTAIAHVIEKDVIRQMLGFETFKMWLVDYPQLPVFRVLSSNAAAAALFHLTPSELNGMIALDLGYPMEELQRLNDALCSYLNPSTQIAAYSTYVPHLPNTSHYVVPGCFLILAIDNEIRPRLTGPLPNVTPVFSDHQTWGRSMWDDVVENCLHYIYHHSQYTTNVRKTLPIEFLSDDKMVFCYAYRNEKEGTHDGYNWKSSRGVLSSAGRLKKKYHYTDLPHGKRLRRRVVWTEDIPHVFMIEYRHAENNSTATDRLIGLDWPRLLYEVHSTNQRLVDAGSHFDMARTRETEEVEPDVALSYVNRVLANWASQHGTG